MNRLFIVLFTCR